LKFGQFSKNMTYTEESGIIGEVTWDNRFNVYQIDFNYVSEGKYISMTKRRICWRFGFSNRDALERGESGTACRGGEHDVVIVWSVISGKRLIIVDGEEIHRETIRGSTFEYTWTMKDKHVLRVITKATPSIRATNTARQYDFFVDGQSFFILPKVFELGIKGPSDSFHRLPGIMSHMDGSNNRLSSDDTYYYMKDGERINALPITTEVR